MTKISERSDDDPGHALVRCSDADDFFELSIDNVCVAGLDGYFKRVSPSWTRTLGWTAEELMSRPSLEFVHPEDHAVTLAGRQRLHGGAELGPLSNRYLCKDGTHRWFEWRSVAHSDRQLVYAVARDITAQKLAEAQLSEAKQVQEKLQRQLIFADRMASVGTLAAGVAHEINNPLAYVLANVQLLVAALRELKKGAFSPQLAEADEMALAAQEGAERIGKIVRDLATFSRAEEERRAVIEVWPLLELAVNMTFNEIRRRARLVKDYGPMPRVEADQARLGQVFINLLLNAAQAIPEGCHDANEIRIVTSTDAAGNAVIEVHDTGAGIPAQIMGRIFDPFFTTKPVGTGTGIGLSICHSIVTALGGEISVTSQESVGTTFRLQLPAATRTAEKAAAAASEKTSFARAAVLVIDDEPAMGKILRRVLREHQVTVVTCARQALELVRSGKHFDVILSDLMMPDMSGMDFYTQLSQSFPRTAERVIFVSGGAYTPTVKAFLERVPNPRIEKPFNAQHLQAMVQRFV